MASRTAAARRRGQAKRLQSDAQIAQPGDCLLAKGRVRQPVPLGILRRAHVAVMVAAGAVE